MTDYDVLNELHSKARDLVNACHDPDLRGGIEGLRRDLWNQVLAAKKRGGVSLVLDLSMPGYVRAGYKGREVTRAHPGHPGLEDAWRILLQGPVVQDTLTASDLVGDVKRPGNTLRNRLATAAEWIDREVGCPELAQALRRPCISISDDGRITRGVQMSIELSSL